MYKILVGVNCSGLDMCNSLIQAAKNLMNAVVLTVKASCVASTKYPRQSTVTSPNCGMENESARKKNRQYALRDLKKLEQKCVRVHRRKCRIRYMHFQNFKALQKAFNILSVSNLIKIKLSVQHHLQNKLVQQDVSFSIMC